MRHTVIPLLVSLPFVTGASAWAEWQPKLAPLMTRWAKDVSPAKVHPEYPRPQMVREHWLNLNGLWDYAIAPKDDAKPQAWDGEILVPFPVESALSGVMKPVGPEKTLWYRRDVTIPKDAAWTDKRVLLHFGAVDWETTVWVNGIEVGQHRGGYDPFSFDITDALFTRKSPTEEIVIRVVDPSDVGYQPRGKQVQNPKGIWYTPTTGIWQTVWLEPVPKRARIASVAVVPDFDSGTFRVLTNVVGDVDGVKVGVGVSYDGKSVATAHGDPNSKLEITIKSPRPWSPAKPDLYQLYVALADENGTIDGIAGYCAMRRISLGKDDQGVTRILLNNKPLFQYGTLDQGFWPDGLYTAPTDEAMKFDIEITKQYGFNLIRKHVKVEPARWYHHCDKLGMLVWQDMPSGDKHAPWDPNGKFDGQQITRSDESAANYRTEWQKIIDALKPHPSIVMWVPFNEAWGQFDTVPVTKWTKDYDPTRLVNCASGGNDFPVGDVVDVHRYPGPFAPKPEDHRAAVLGEYGGLGLPLKGHTWQGEKNWGYRSFTTQAALTEAYLDLIDKLHPMIDRDGLSAAIYTQTTDVEIEVNGLLTYDREIQKIPVADAAQAHQQLWQPAPMIKTLVPTAETAPVDYRYTETKPGDGWQQAAFEEASWQAGRGGFGDPTTPGSAVHTEWKSSDIWLRREFSMAKLPAGELRLRMHHDEDAEVYLNGVLLKQVTGYTTGYQSFRITPDGHKALKAGKNVLAVHCHQTGGGQYIDVGLDVRMLAP